MTDQQKRPAHRPPIMEDGKRVNVYLDAASLAKAAEIGAGNVSEGIRRALADHNQNEEIKVKFELKKSPPQHSVTPRRHDRNRGRQLRVGWR